MDNTKPIKNRTISMSAQFSFLREGEYSNIRPLNIAITDEPLPPTMDPVKYLAARLTEELARQAPLVRAAYTPEGKVSDDEVTVA